MVTGVSLYVMMCTVGNPSQYPDQQAVVACESHLSVCHMLMLALVGEPVMSAAVSDPTLALVIKLENLLVVQAFDSYLPLLLALDV